LELNPSLVVFNNKTNALTLTLSPLLTGRQAKGEGKITDLPSNRAFRKGNMRGKINPFDSPV
jgi:hypothetical protein